MKFYSIIKYQSGKMMHRDVYKGGIAMRYDAFHPGQVWLDTEKTEMYEKYLDPTLSAEERADDLLAKMSLDEKFAQTQCGFAERLLEDGAYPYGMGQVSCLFASMLKTLDEGETVIGELQKRIMEASPHHIPAIFHVETATGSLLP